MRRGRAPRGGLQQQASFCRSRHCTGPAAAGPEVEGARAKLRAARDGRWPTVDANVSYTRLNAAPQLVVVTPGFTFRSGPIFKDDQYVSGSVQLKLPLYAGGRITAGFHAARDSLTEASAQEQATLSDLKLAVAEAYVGGSARAQRARDGQCQRQEPERALE